MIPSLLIDAGRIKKETQSLKSNEKNESPVNQNYSTISLLILSLLSLSLSLPFSTFLQKRSIVYLNYRFEYSLKD